MSQSCLPHLVLAESLPCLKAQVAPALPCWNGDAGLKALRTREAQAPQACCTGSGRRAQTPGQSSLPGRPCAGRGRRPSGALATHPRLRLQSRPRTEIPTPAMNAQPCQMFAMRIGGNDVQTVSTPQEGHREDGYHSGDSAAAIQHSSGSKLRVWEKIPLVRAPLHRWAGWGCQSTSAHALQLPGRTPPESSRRDLQGIELSKPDFASLALCRFCAHAHV